MKEKTSENPKKTESSENLENMEASNSNQVAETIPETPVEKPKEPRYTEAEVSKMTVAQLTSALKKANVDIPLKSRKQALQDLLLSHLKTNNLILTEAEAETSANENEKKPEETTGRGRPKRKAATVSQYSH